MCSTKVQARAAALTRRPCMQVSEWLIKLGTVSEIMEQWFQVQNVWTYMEAVFSGGDIVKQLPQEAKRFTNIDKNFMKIVSMATETQNVVDVCNGSDLVKSMLPHLQEQLELCQKSLSAYLETKRGEFPRFYFVSDPTLLEILSLGSHPPSVVPHFMSGLFDSLSDVHFDEADASKISHMVSPQHEVVEMDTPVDTKGNIEVWLQRLVDGMKDTVCAITKRANSNVHRQELETFIFGHPAQIALLGIQFMWTADTQSALTSSKTDKSIMSKNMKKTDAILKEMITITVKTSLTKIQRTNLETCITVHMHQKESTEDLLKKKIKDPTDFEWLKQARFYWREDRNTVIISICDVDFQYSFEYLGVKERLVVTPLTDVCYITLSQARCCYTPCPALACAASANCKRLRDCAAVHARTQLGPVSTQWWRCNVQVMCCKLPEVTVVSRSRPATRTSVLCHDTCAWLKPCGVHHTTQSACRRSACSSAARPPGRPAQARRRRRKTSAARSASMSSCSTAPTKWTTSAWARSTRA